MLPKQERFGNVCLLNALPCPPEFPRKRLAEPKLRPHRSVLLFVGSENGVIRACNVLVWNFWSTREPNGPKSLKAKHFLTKEMHYEHFESQTRLANQR